MALLANKFPKAKRFQVVNLGFSPSLYYSHVRQQNIIENKTHTLPFRLIDREGTGLDISTFVARNSFDEQMVGSMADLEGWLEAGIWVTSRDGDRIPAEFGSLVVELGSPLRGWKF